MDAIARILKLLNQRGWSKYRLAKEANLSPSTIASMIKNGKSPSLATIEDCCRAFGITLAEFFSDDIIEDSEFSCKEKALVMHWRKLPAELKEASYIMIRGTCVHK